MLDEENVLLTAQLSKTRQDGVAKDAAITALVRPS